MDKYMPYILVIATFCISVLFASMIIPRILLIAKSKKLYDMPDKRKVHTEAIPRLGGVSFFPTVLFSFCYVFALSVLINKPIYTANTSLPQLLLFVCGMTILYVTGIADDLVGLRYRQKFLIQIICAAFFPVSGLWINDLQGLFGLELISPWFGVPFTIFTVVFITNAINLIDGIDGLASGLSSVSLITLGLLFAHQGFWVYSMVAFAMVGVLIPFFYYNVFGSAVRARKLFMGDTGSLTLGYVISFLVIKFSVGHAPSTTGTIVIAFSTLIIPMFDVIRVVCVRLIGGQNPFQPDKNHIHHKLLDLGYSPRRSMIYLITIACLFCILNILLLPYCNPTILLIGNVVVWFALNYLWEYKRKSKQKNVPASGSEYGIKPTHDV